MAQANPSRIIVDIPFEIEVKPNGTKTIVFPHVRNFLMEDIPTLSTGNTTEKKDTFSVGYFDEAWLAKYRSKLDNLESELMPRMIMAYYGLWPEDCTEYVMFKYISQLFDEVEDLVIKRAVLARRLWSISGKSESKLEYNTGCPELKKLDISLMNPIYEFYEQFGILEVVCAHPSRSAQNPEVAAFIDDLDKHSDEFRDSAWDERTKVMDERESEMKLSM